MAPATDAPAAPVFLLSPANCGGRRAQALLREGAASPLACRLREGTLTLGEAFSFVSGLYFRGKLTYARAFGASAGCHVITPTRGLMSPAALVSLDLLLEFASVDVSAGDARYHGPLVRDLEALVAALPPVTPFVLLGSIATGKYVDVLAPVLGERLHYPPSFVGRGDMSRGGLLLRCAANLVELDYARLEAGTCRRGARPPKLEPIATA